MTKLLKLPRSLNAKLMTVILLALAFSLLVFIGADALGTYMVDAVYMSPESVSARKAEIYSDFSAYVSLNKISGTDSAAVARWDGSNEYVSIIIYKGGEPDMHIRDGQAQPFSSLQPQELQQYSGQYGKLYPLRFADGTYRIAINDSSQSREYLVNKLIAFLVSAVCFVLILLFYFRGLTRRIISLAREAVEIGAGDLERPIPSYGEDEIAMLAREIDNMRRSVIERMGNERRAWQANSELITAISHDIRTPMTTMIGYLGLLNDSDFEDKERCRQFTSAAYDKAMELKDLTDELFKYFLVFGKAELEMEMETYDARLLLTQLLGEAEFDLSDAGFNVQHIDFEGECSVSADPMYLKRVIDNLVSNVKKYADKDRPVVFLTEVQGKKLSVCVSNRIAGSMPKVESTKIGIRTCRKIIEHMGGSFSTALDDGHFAAEFTLPVS